MEYPLDWDGLASQTCPGHEKQSRVGFVLKRVAVTLLAYLFADAVISMPLPEESIVEADRAALFLVVGFEHG